MMKTIASKTIAFNGKFFGSAPTGVLRVAEQLVAATDALIAITTVFPSMFTEPGSCST